MCNIINKAEKDFYKKSLHDNKNNFKTIFNICNNLLGNNLDLPLQSSVNNKILAKEFNTFFTDKIAKIRENLQHTREECNLVQSATYINETCNLLSDQLMKNFTLVDHKDVIKCIKELQIGPHPNRDPQRYSSGNFTLTHSTNQLLIRKWSIPR